MINEWICADCGQESHDIDTECSICGADRATLIVARVSQKHSHFEVDGKKIAYDSADNLLSDRTAERGDY